MAGRKQLALNRAVLLLICGLSLMSPIIVSRLFAHDGNVEGLVELGDAYSRPISSEGGMEDVAIHKIILIKIILIAYAAGVACVALIYLVSIGRIASIAARSRREKVGVGDVMVYDDGNMEAFNFGNTIFISRSLYATDKRRMVLAHESAHVRLRHWVDLLLSQIVIGLQWYNPVAWMLKDSLKEIHEYQADESVIKQGVDPLDYQLFLVSAAFSSKFNLPANFLNAGNMRKRICMMNDNGEVGLRRLVAVSVIPFLALGLFACDLAPVKALIRQFNDYSFYEKSSDDEGAEDWVEYEGPNEELSIVKDAMVSDPSSGNFIGAEYADGRMALMQFINANIKYPEIAEANKKQGKVIISFQIAADGEVMSVGVNASADRWLDEEALRVCGMVSKFTPATLDGRPVESIYNLPITFKLPQE